MAYMNQEKKAQIAALIKPLLKEYGLKGTLSVHNYSTITLNVKQGPIDFIASANEVIEKNSGIHVDGVKKYLDVNVYWVADNYTGVAKEFLLKAVKALQGANYYDKSDAMIDYFDTAYYYGIKIGNWDKPYNLVK
jgi:ABC-type proline/glycine betaine transport system substrate-binding protein